MEDTSKAFLEIIKSKNLFGKIVNVGSGEEISIKDTAILIKKLLNSNSKVLEDKNRVRLKTSELKDSNVIIDWLKIPNEINN